MAYKCFFRCARCGGTNRVSSDRIHQSPVCGRCGEALDTTGAPMELPDDEVDRVFQKAPVPVLVDFYADWCSPCHQLAPVLERAGAEYAGRLWVVKVDVERSRKGQEFGIQAVPTVYLFKDREVVARRQGFRGWSELEALLERHVTFYEG